jgi:SH3-like domain-containing protein
MHHIFRRFLLLVMLSFAASAALAQPAKLPPYWASIAKSEALMRVGPSTDYPANWLYKRTNLPLRVVETYPNWRKVQDPDGIQGWMHVRLLKDQRTVIVRGGVADMRNGPSEQAKVILRLEPGVVGVVEGCENQWCQIEVQGQKGHVAKRSLWGAVDER